MKTIYLLFFSWWFLLVANATSVKTPQTGVILNIRGLLELYKENHDNNLPKTWQEFIDSGVFAEDLLNDARRMLDIENRYAFVDMKPIQLNRRTVRIVIMAKQPGGEGDRVNTEEPEKTKGRWLFMEASDGSIHIGTVPEVMLDYWFKKAGLDLANYTFPAPPPPAFTAPPQDPNSEGLILGGPNSSNYENTRAVKNSPKREAKSRSPHSEDDAGSPESTSWIIWIVGVIAAIGALALARAVRKKSVSCKPSQTSR